MSEENVFDDEGNVVGSSTTVPAGGKSMSENWSSLGEVERIHRVAVAVAVVIFALFNASSFLPYFVNASSYAAQTIAGILNGLLILSLIIAGVSYVFREK